MQYIRIYSNSIFMVYGFDALLCCSVAYGCRRVNADSYVCKHNFIEWQDLVDFVMQVEFSCSGITWSFYLRSSYDAFTRTLLALLPAPFLECFELYNLEISELNRSHDIFGS